MRRITIILNVPTTRRIRQPVLQPQTLHNTRLGDILGRTLCLQQRLGPTFSRPRQRDERVRLHAEDMADGGAGVEAGCQGAAGGFDSGDCGGGGARDDEVDGLFEGCGGAAEDLDAVLGLVDAAGVGEFADGDGAGWVDAALVDPFLDALEVDGGHFGGEAGGKMWLA